MSKILDWLDHRTGYKSFVNEALYERVPGGARWRYVWGSALVFAFVVQMITGFFLWAAYSPNAQGAWESVYYIQYEMQGGWLLRGVHHFMAQAMIVLLALHLMQVVIDGAYKAPREINFWLGLVLMLIVLGLSLTGYLLPWDQKGYWATKVATNIMAITPGIGPELQKVVVGGSSYGHHTLTRFFAIHAGLLPALLIGFLVLHIYVFRRHGLTVRKQNPQRDTTFWPDQVLKDGVASLAVLATVLFLVFLPALQGKDYLGAELGAPADPTEPYSAARPEWYFLFLFQLLKYFPGETEVIGAHVIPGAVLLLMFLMPFLGRWQLGHRFNVLFLCVLMGAIGFLTWRALDQDWKDPNYRAASREAQDIAERVPLLVQEYGISTEGAVALVRNDPFIQGPKIFARQCASCHRYDGHDGTGRIPLDEATAADLGNFGTRDWMRAVLTDYATVFAPLKNAVWQGENVGDKFLQGDMAQWSEENAAALAKPENQESLEALLDFMAAQAQRSDLPQPEPEQVELGKEVFEFGDLKDGSMLSSACADCHAMHALGDDDALALDSGLAPTLTGYGSAEWLADFIAHPEKHYGSKNAMPAFAERLSEREMDLLVRWMTGDYLKPH